eukprot:354470-Chlamydomonas_euryale.AAC.27
MSIRETGRDGTRCERQISEEAPAPLADNVNINSSPGYGELLHRSPESSGQSEFPQMHAGGAATRAWPSDHSQAAAA